MADQSDDTEKSFDPTPRKLEEARRKGDVPRSQDLNATAAYAGLFLALIIVSSGALFSGATGLMVFVDQPAQLAPQFFDGRSSAPMGQAIQQSFGFLAIVFITPIIAVILSAIAQRSVTFAPSKIAPKLNRVSPISVAKQKFGPSGLFEFLKSFLKLAIYSTILAIFIYRELPGMIITPELAPTQSMVYLSQLFLNFLGIVVIVTAAIGAIDFAFQHFDHRRKLRMSRKEIQDEMKDSEGDPFLKQERLQRGRERATGQSLQDVATADVVITNPTHFAVALHWSREQGTAPSCVAKGTDEMAHAIRKIAVENGVPIHADPPTARALHATTKIGQEIPPDLYRAVATAIRFAETMRRRVKERGY